MSRAYTRAANWLSSAGSKLSSMVTSLRERSRESGAWLLLRSTPRLLCSQPWVGTGPQPKRKKENGKCDAPTLSSGAAAADPSGISARGNAEKAAVKCGVTVHVPASVFPDEPAPECGYWVGVTKATSLGGKGDIGVQCAGEDLFTWPRSEVAQWVV